jgi:hypothetical protein
MTTVICSEPVTIDLELSGATLQVQTDSLVVYTVEWRRWWQVWRPRCQSPGLPALHLHLRRRGEVPARSGFASCSGCVSVSQPNTSSGNSANSRS